MFLWTVRHIICAGEDRQPLSPLVIHFFDDAGLPDAVGRVVALLRTLSAGAHSPLTVNVPCGVDVLPDEQILINGLLDVKVGRLESLRFALQRRIRESACDAVISRLRAVADQLAALENLRGSGAARRAATLH